jgi:hypothetical protein
MAKPIMELIMEKATPTRSRTWAWNLDQDLGNIRASPGELWGCGRVYRPLAGLEGVNFAEKVNGLGIRRPQACV